MLTQFHSCKYIFIFLLGALFPYNYTFNSAFGNININNPSQNIKNNNIEKIIVKHIEFMNSSFPQIYTSPINISIIESIKSTNNKNYTWKWSLGITRGKNTIVLKNPSITHITKNRFYKVIKHELGHIYLNRLNNGNNQIPRWFSEGFCLKLASEISITHHMNIIKYINNKNIFDINMLDEKFINNSKKDFEFAYSFSGLIINIMIDLYGEDILYKLVDELNNGMNFNDAFYKSTLVEFSQFNNIIFNEIEYRYKWMKLIKFPNFLFVLFPLFLIIAFIIIKYKNKKLLLNWELEEILENEENNDKIE